MDETRSLRLMLMMLNKLMLPPLRGHPCKISSHDGDMAAVVVQDELINDFYSDGEQTETKKRRTSILYHSSPRPFLLLH